MPHKSSHSFSSTLCATKAVHKPTSQQTHEGFPLPNTDIHNVQISDLNSIACNLCHQALDAPFQRLNAGELTFSTPTRPHLLRKDPPLRQRTSTMYSRTGSDSVVAGHIPYLFW